MLLTASLGWLGAGLSMALPWPQVWRSVTQGRTSGLSSTACWQGAAMPAGWITYGLLTHQAVQVVTNVVTGLAGLAVLVMVLITQREQRTVRVLRVSAAGAAGILVAAAGSALAAALPGVGAARAAVALGSVLAVGGIMSAIPQPLSLLRDRTQDLSGLSRLRWRLGAGACACWCAFGLGTGQPPVWLSASVGLAGSLTVCWVLRSADRAAQPRERRVVTGGLLVARGVAALPRPSGGEALAPATPAPRAIAPVIRPARAFSHVVRPAYASALEHHPAFATAQAFPAAPASVPAFAPTAALTSTSGVAVAARRSPPGGRPARAGAGPTPLRPAHPSPARGIARVPRVTVTVRLGARAGE
jgi:hypothetical protein